MQDRGEAFNYLFEDLKNSSCSKVYNKDMKEYTLLPSVNLKRIRMVRYRIAWCHMLNFSQGDFNCPTFGKIIKTSELFIQSTKSRVYISYSSWTGVTLGGTHLFEFSANYMAKEVTLLLLVLRSLSLKRLLFISQLYEAFVKYEEMSRID